MAWPLRSIRIGLIILAIGCLLMLQGCQLIKASWGASSEPEQVELQQLEAGNMPENRHLAIGNHIAYPKGGMIEGRSYIIYPIGSYSGNPDEVPTEDVFLQNAVRSARVLVRSYAFRNETFIPEAMPVESVTGLVMGRGKDLPSKERNILKRRMDVSSVDDLIVLQEGKKPSMTLGILITVGGVVLFAVGAFSAALSLSNANL